MTNVSGSDDSVSPTSSVPGTAEPAPFSHHTLDKATKAKLTLENYYSQLITQQRYAQMSNVCTAHNLSA